MESLQDMLKEMEDKRYEKEALKYQDILTELQKELSEKDIKMSDPDIIKLVDHFLWCFFARFKTLNYGNLLDYFSVIKETIPSDEESDIIERDVLFLKPELHAKIQVKKDE